MNTPTYYQQVKSAVLPRLQWFKDDLLQLDRKALRGYTGPFLHASRDSGTDLVQFDSSILQAELSIEAAEAFALRTGNSLFLYGSGGQVRQVTRKQAEKLFSDHCQRIRAEWKRATMGAAA